MRPVDEWRVREQRNELFLIPASATKPWLPVRATYQPLCLYKEQEWSGVEWVQRGEKDDEVERGKEEKER
jgi:hypothetical protein